jgi:hypothetical protein
MNQNKGDNLDRILDEGLATYSSREPWPGLEERVLSRVASAAEAKRRRIWRWVFLAIPAAACLLVALSVDWRKPEVGLVQVPNQVAKVRSEPPVRQDPPAPAPLPRVQKRVPVKKIVPAPSQIAKRDLFPTPVPLSREERALISLALVSPMEAPPVFGESTPIQVEPIQIEPLEIDGNSEEKF